ncbi:heterodisulfide reductase-related iron-sulfur binding cluster, partial [Streptococcus hyovaginalis]
MKVTLFSTCIVDMVQRGGGKATVELLERLGCEIDFPATQICCGQPSYNSGYVKETKEVMKTMMKSFQDAEYIVCPSGSCAYMFHEYQHIFKGDPVWEPLAKELAVKKFEPVSFTNLPLPTPPVVWTLGRPRALQKQHRAFPASAPPPQTPPPRLPPLPPPHP